MLLEGPFLPQRFQSGREDTVLLPWRGTGGLRPYTALRTSTFNVKARSSQILGSGGWVVGWVGRGLVLSERWKSFTLRKLVLLPGQTYPVSCLPRKWSPTKISFTGPVSSLASETRSLISSFNFLLLLVLYPWCSALALLRCYLQDSFLMFTSASSIQRQLKKLLL